MSKFSQNIINNYKKLKEYRRVHNPWLWRAQNSAISKIADCEKFIVFLAIVFLSIPLLVFISECFESGKAQLLIGVAGIVVFAIIAIPKTRRSIILRPDPAKSIDRIVVASILGMILFVVGTAGLEPSSSSSSSSYSDWEEQWQKDEAEASKENKRQQEKQYYKENENQRSFYSELSAPKILYKCKNEDLEHAYGVNYGTYNRLLEKAIADCGEDNLKIIKNEK